MGDELLNTAKETRFILEEFMAMSAKNWERQQNFNTFIYSEIMEIKELALKLKQLSGRLAAVEERGANFEQRLTNAENRLKAS